MVQAKSFLSTCFALATRLSPRPSELPVPPGERTHWAKRIFLKTILRSLIELVSKELNHLAAILHVYAGNLNFLK